MEGRAVQLSDEEVDDRILLFMRVRYEEEFDAGPHCLNDISQYVLVGYRAENPGDYEDLDEGETRKQIERCLRRMCTVGMLIPAESLDGVSWKHSDYD